MRRKQLKFLLACLMVSVLFSGFVVQSIHGEEGGDTSQMTLPPDAKILGATLNLNVVYPTGQQINVHRITKAWDEMEVTWGNFEQSFDEEWVASFVPAETGYVACDVTDLVNGWMNGISDHGLLLDQVDFFYPRTRFNSREHSNAPFLEIEYQNGGITETIQIVPKADSYIWEKRPDQNGGTSNVLYMGWNTPTDLEKQILIAFDIPVPSKCRGPMYWRKHSKYGKKEYNDAWADLPEGEDTPFFLSGMTFYKALKTKPKKKGKAYYALARAYIAAQLNIFNGCYEPPEIVVEVTNAFELLSTFTPKQFSKFNKKQKKQLLKMVIKLGKYNKGKLY